MRIIDPALLLAFRLRGRCEWCRKACAVEPHHLWRRGMGGGSRLDIEINLVSLCRVCHTLTHASAEPTKQALLAIVAEREKMLQHEIVAEIRCLQRLDKNGRERPRNRPSPANAHDHGTPKKETPHDPVPPDVPAPGTLGRSSLEADSGGWHDL